MYFLAHSFAGFKPWNATEIGVPMTSEALTEIHRVPIHHSEGLEVISSKALVLAASW
jgi:hypothetical protein